MNFLFQVNHIKEVESITGYSRSTLFRIKKKIEESEGSYDGGKSATVKYQDSNLKTVLK